MRGGLVPILFFTVACAQTQRPCGGKVLVVWPSAQGVYQPSVVTVSTLPDTRRLSGPAAKVYYESKPADGGYSGPVAEPHLTTSGDVCVPTDAGSAVAMSAYAQFERLLAFDQSLGVADQLTWPRQVGVETRLSGNPTDVRNNAHYMGEKDLVILVPSTGEGVPLAMNLGVVAHEHFHAHFQSQVLRLLNVQSTTNLIVDLLPRALTDIFVDNTSTDHVRRQTNDYVLRGWNEGLADLYAAVYLDQPDFLSASFGGAGMVRGRALNGELLVMGTDQIETKVRALTVSTGAAADSARQELSGLAYAQGSALARALWKVVHDDPASSAKDNLAKIMKSLKRLGTELNQRVNATELGADVVLPILLHEVNLSVEMCEQLHQLTYLPAGRTRVSACAPL